MLPRWILDEFIYSILARGTIFVISSSSLQFISYLNSSSFLFLGEETAFVAFGIIVSLKLNGFSKLFRIKFNVLTVVRVVGTHSNKPQRTKRCLSSQLISKSNIISFSIVKLRQFNGWLHKAQTFSLLWFYNSSTAVHELDLFIPAPDLLARTFLFVHLSTHCPQAS